MLGFCKKDNTEKEQDRKDSTHLRYKFKIPEIVDVDIDAKLRGKYKTKSQQAKGLVIHYTAGAFSPAETTAKRTLKYLASKGLGCMVMDINGTIYKARNQQFDDIAYHAGKSSWLGKSGVSQYCMGMEICCAGRLSPSLQTAWGQALPDSIIRHSHRDFDNVKLGSYHKFTQLQENSLKNFILWQLDVNPEFSIDWVVGHDEISPGRKTDPGYSLSMSMPEYREMLKQAIKP